MLGLLRVVRLTRVNPVPAVILIVVALIDVDTTVRRVVHVGALITRTGLGLAAGRGEDINVDTQGQIDPETREEAKALNGSREGEGGKSLSLHCCCCCTSDAGIGLD